MSRRKILYDPSLKARASVLRNHSTIPEIKLWKFLKGRQMCGYDFHRQKPIDRFIVDFFCCELNLAIELDGTSHIGREKYDAFRQQAIEKLGITFLRFTNDEVFNNIQDVLGEIKGWIEKNEEKEKRLEKTQFTGRHPPPR